jgi:flagellar FliJ protein
MSRFIFKLDGVLQHRERIEQDRQRELSVVVAEMTRLEAELLSMNQELQRTTTDVRDHHLVGRLDMRYLAAHRRYMLGMQRKVYALAQEMTQQQQLVDEARRAMAEASKQRKILEKLRERHQQEWAQAEARREAGDLDELTTQLSYRNLQRMEDAP